jgi:hypothetical protein
VVDDADPLITLTFELQEDAPEDDDDEQTDMIESVRFGGFTDVTLPPLAHLSLTVFAKRVFILLFFEVRNKQREKGQTHHFQISPTSTTYRGSDPRSA